MVSQISKEDVENIVIFVKEIYHNMIKASGGLEGIRDEGGLYNSMWKILKEFNKNKEPSSLGAFIYKELATRHHFIDGNKRTSHLVAKLFLMLKGIHLKVHYKDAAAFIIEIGYGKKTIEEIKKWIEENSEPYNKETEKGNVLDEWISDMLNK